MKKLFIICITLLFIRGYIPYHPNFQELIFYPGRIDYSVGNNPWSITSGDYNQDGSMDIVTANKEDDVVSVLLGNGNGTFNSPSKFNVGEEPLTIISSFFNEDNFLDLATSNFRSNNISVLLGNGDGTFQDSINFNVGITPRCVQSEDFNRDGKLDLAVSNRDNYTISILQGKGDGTFTDAVEFSTGSLKPRLLVTGDFNRDTFVDLAFVHAEPVQEYGGIVGILLGNGDGTFGEIIIAFVDVLGYFLNATSITTAYFNADEFPDLAVGVSVTGGEETDYVSILLGNGDGSFLNANPIHLGYDGEKPFYLTTVDFNKDDNMDLIVTGSGGSNISIHSGNGDGTFNTKGFYSTAQYPRWITVEDFNDDSNLDIATANEGLHVGGTTSILLGNGDGSFIVSPTIAVDTTQSYTGVAEDFDCDGLLDLAIANWGLSNATNGVLSILNGNGDGTFILSDSYTIGKAAKVIIAEKFNNDEHLDLAIVQDRSHNVAVLINNGDGSFQQPVEYATDLNPLSMSYGDFNQDDKLDLVTCNFNGNNFSVLPGNGDGTFGMRTDFPTSQGSHDIISGDVNGDFKLDVIVLCSEIAFNINLIAVHFGNGDRSFGTANTFDIPGSFAWDMEGADFNKDNKLDLVVTDLDSNNVYLYLGNGDGTFSTGSLIGFVPDPRSVKAGDLNNDNMIDIVVSSTDNNNFILFLGNGDGTFSQQEPGYGSEGAWGLIPGDFDGDNDLDIAITTGIFGEAHITVINNNSIATKVEPENLTSVPDNFLLEQNYPNPFNPATTIKYTIPPQQNLLTGEDYRGGLVSLKVYDVLGNEIATLVNEYKDAGTYEIIFNAADITSGIYFYSLQAGSFVLAKKMILIK